MDFVLLTSWALRLTGPLLLIGTGAALSGKAGVFPWGMEGMVALSACVAALLWQKTQVQLWCVLGGLGTGVMVAALCGGFSLWRKENSLLAGMGVNVLCLGLAALLGTGLSAGESTPLAAPLELGQVLRQTPVFWAGCFGLLLFALLLYATRWGLRLRVADRHALALEARGIRVEGMRWVCLLAAGALAGFAGTSLSFGNEAFAWQDALGYGFAGLIIARVGRNTPQGVLLGALLLGTAGAWVGQGTRPGPENAAVLALYLAVMVALALSGFSGARQADPERVSTVSTNVDKMWTKKWHP